MTLLEPVFKRTSQQIQWPVLNPCYLINPLIPFFTLLLGHLSSSSLSFWLFFLSIVFLLIFLNSFIAMHKDAIFELLPHPNTHSYSRWSHPVPSLNTIFILITFNCLFLALISLLKLRLKYPAIYSVFPFGCLMGISNLKYPNWILDSIHLKPNSNRNLLLRRLCLFQERKSPCYQLLRLETLEPSLTSPSLIPTSNLIADPA